MAEKQRELVRIRSPLVAQLTVNFFGGEVIGKVATVVVRSESLAASSWMALAGGFPGHGFAKVVSVGGRGGALAWGMVRGCSCGKSDVVGSFQFFGNDFWGVEDGHLQWHWDNVLWEGRL